MKIKHPLPLVFLALLLGWVFDQFFYKTPGVGVSFFAFVALCLVAGAILTWNEQRRVPISSLLLLIPILYLALMSFMLDEPLTRSLNYLLTLGGMTILAATWLGGRWWQYTLVNYAVNFLRLFGNVLVKPLQAVPAPTGAASTTGTAEGSAEQKARIDPKVRHTTLAVVRGLFLAAPVVMMLCALLAAADAVFSQQVENFLRLFDLERWDEYLLRLFYIGLMAYLLSGVYLFSLLGSEKEQVSGKAAIPSRDSQLPYGVGWVEALVVLGSVNLLFFSFVLVQVRYFFGGDANIHLDGFTYAQYARRGFGELVMVAIFSLGIFLVLGALTRRPQRLQQQVFTAFGTGLFALVTVILVSAFQRLLLYEAVYGFTRIRTGVHVFMVWLGMLLLMTVVLEGFGRLRYFALALVLVCVAYGVTLNVIQVDPLIVRRNVERLARGQTFEDANDRIQGTLDSAYLVSLSADATPVLMDYFLSPELPDGLHAELGGVLACRWAEQQAEARQNRPWTAFRWSLQRAERLYQVHAEALEAYPVRQERDTYWVTVNGEEKLCRQNEWID